MAEALPFLGIIWLLTTTLGINGAALGWSMRMTVDACAMFWVAGMRANVVPALAPSAALLLASGAAGYFFGSSLSPRSPFRVCRGLDRARARLCALR